MRGITRHALLAAAVVPALLLAGCGGDDARQDADEPSGTYAMRVVDASFKPRQELAEQTDMEITVRNVDNRTVPNVAVTVDSFSRRSEQAGLADPERPVWVIDSPPRGGVTAYTNTWALGPLRPGEQKTFRWRVTPVEPGSHDLSYRVAAGLDGKAKAVLPGGGAPAGTFDVRILRRPSDSRVDPATGRVVDASDRSGGRDRSPDRDRTGIDR